MTPRSGQVFSLPQTSLLQVGVSAVAGLDQHVVVERTSPGGVPPDPCFQLTSWSTSATQAGRVTMRVDDASKFAIVGPSGEALHVCAGTNPKTAGFAAGTPVSLWTSADMKSLNTQVMPRSGLEYGFVNHVAGDPVKQTLTTLVTNDDIGQQVIVSTPGTRSTPPDPCFAIDVAPIGEKTPVKLQVLRYGSFQVFDADGNAAQLCDSTGKARNL
ncbi:MAG: hypothetical protein QM831_00720 [Kofleriaceae bacterium]